jgi:PBP1b-binding outer membrane lipoprotein LpoB
LHKRFTMKMKYTLTISVLVFTFSSCSEISNQLDDKQKQLESKINSLDSTVNYEVERVKVIDSLVKQEKAAIDSLVKLRTE